MDETETDDIAGPKTVRNDAEIRGLLGIVSPQELAGALGVYVGTLKQWRYRGVGPPYVSSERNVYYRLHDVVEYLHKRTKHPVNTEASGGEEKRQEG